jgi:hypothetical protein
MVFLVQAGSGKKALSRPAWLSSLSRHTSGYPLTGTMSQTVGRQRGSLSGIQEGLHHERRKLQQ